MVASLILEEMLKDPAAQHNQTKQQEDKYVEVFGSMENAKLMVHYLENHTSALPMGTRIAKDQFRRVFNTKQAAIASFFALAAYDEETFKLAHGLILEKKCGVAIMDS
jgi:hypothetical protein